VNNILVDLNAVLKKNKVKNIKRKKDLFDKRKSINVEK